LILSNVSQLDIEAGILDTQSANLLSKPWSHGVFCLWQGFIRM